MAAVLDIRLFETVGAVGVVLPMYHSSTVNYLHPARDPSRLTPPTAPPPHASQPFLTVCVFVIDQSADEGVPHRQHRPVRRGPAVGEHRGSVGQQGLRVCRGRPGAEVQGFRGADVRRVQPARGLPSLGGGGQRLRREGAERGADRHRAEQVRNVGRAAEKSQSKSSGR